MKNSRQFVSEQCKGVWEDLHPILGVGVKIRTSQATYILNAQGSEKSITKTSFAYAIFRLDAVPSLGIAERAIPATVHGNCRTRGVKRDILDHPIPRLIKDYSRVVELLFFLEDRKESKLSSTPSKLWPTNLNLDF